MRPSISEALAATKAKSVDSRPTSDESTQLSDQQRSALDKALRGENLFLTGPGGTGKSETVRHMIKELRHKHRYPGCVAVTASTGAAAVHLNGCTIHSLLGTTIAGSVEDITTNRRNFNIQQSERIYDRLSALDVIIVDEVSMLSGDFISMMDYRLRDICSGRNGDQTPFGGKQVIFVGDFFQLPPVEDADLLSRSYRYAFQSPAWRSANVDVIELTRVFRQSDAEFIGHLTKVRRGEVDDDTEAYFNARVRAKLTLPTRLHALRINVEHINRQNLDQLSGASVKLRATFEGDTKYRSALFGTSRKSSIVDETIELKVGAPVMFTRNLYDFKDDAGRDLTRFVFANGERGVVKDIDKDAVTVRKHDNTEIVVNRLVYEYKTGSGRVAATVRQFPLRLAWAVTIHKAQGATLDEVECDVSSCFADGHAYVALSRARTYEGLSLTTPIKPDAITADPAVVKYYDAMARGEDPYGDQFNPTTPVPTRCEACGVLLGRPKGYADTGLCGSCATGRSDLMSEFGETW